MYNDIIIWNIWKESTYVWWSKNWELWYVDKWWDIFKEWTKVIFNDPDDWEEFTGEIEWIVLNDDLTIEASIKDIAYWRVDINILDLNW